MYPQITPKIGIKYATVDVFTAPIFSIKRIYPKKANPVEINANHNTENIVWVDGNCEGKLNRENGIKIKEAKMSDQPIKTTAFVLKAYFSMLVLCRF